VLRMHRFPKPVLPIAGGLLFAILIGTWYTSAWWLYNRSSSRPATYAGVNVIPAAASPTAGRAVFLSAGCGSCHVFKAAGAGGQIGPNLDTLRPTYDAAFAQVQRGGGGMPAFKGQLKPDQIRDVAAFVASSAGAPAGH
jgi:cytochrome c6